MKNSIQTIDAMMIDRSSNNQDYFSLLVSSGIIDDENSMETKPCAVYISFIKILIKYE